MRPDHKYGHARARVFKDDFIWRWRCTRCPNYGGGSLRWRRSFNDARLHLNYHYDGVFR